MKTRQLLFQAALLALAIIAAPLGAAAQEAGPELPITVRSVDFEVKGRTLDFVLRQKLEADGPVVGRSFQDLSAFEAFVADRRQVLLNNRVLASVAATYDLSPGSAGGSDAALHFAVVDTWNIIALPEPKYDSNTGLTLYVKGRDYDFAGSMQTLNLDLSYVSDTASNKSFEIDTSFVLPFKALDNEWTLGISEDAQFWTNNYPWKSSTSLSLSLKLPGLGFPANVTATQGLYYNADQPVATELDPLYLGESLAFDASIPLGLKLGALGGLYYAPVVTVSENWWPGASLGYPGRAGTQLSFSNSLTTGRVDWQGNMRSGMTLSASAVPSVNLLSEAVNWDVSGGMSAYQSWFDQRLGLAARLTVLDRIYGDPYALGGYLRGILDARVNGVAGVFANLDLPVKLFVFPAHLLIKKNWLDFELQAKPFIDAGIVAPDRSAKPSGSWAWASGGMEFLVFPVIMRSFIVRASIGWDLRSVLETRSLTAKTSDGSKPYEIYFGTGIAY